MKSTLKFIVFVLLISFNSIAQQRKAATVNYAKIPISVPEGYRTTSEYELKNEIFSAQWIYISKQMVEQNIHLQLLEQIAAQVPVEEIGPIEFISSNGKFAGKKYKLKDQSGNMKYVVFAFGIVNDQPLILNLHFNLEPLDNKNFDATMQKFILFQE